MLFIKTSSSKCFAILTLLIGFLFSFSGASLAQQMSFYGPDSVRGTLRFETYFVTEATEEVKLKKGDQTVKVKKQKTEANLKKEALEHTKYLYGVFMYQTYKDKHGEIYDYSHTSGAVDDSAKVELAKTGRTFVDSKKKLIRVDYSYEDRAIFHDDLWAEYDDIGWIDLKFLLPTRPATIYKDARSLLPPRSEIAEKTLPTPCTSKFDNSPWSFFYYWSHSLKDCPESFQDFLHEVRADFVPQVEDESVAPHYQKFLSQNKKGAFEATVFYGVDENYKEKDLGVRGFREAVRKVRELKSQTGEPLFDELRPSEQLKKRYVFDFQSKLLGKTRLHLVLVNPEEERFIQQAKRALSHDIVAYNGHSSDGEYFNLGKFFDRKRPRLGKDFQVIFMDSCSSYTFYHANFFQDKPQGSKNLHLVLNAIGATYVNEGIKDNRFNSPTLGFVVNLFKATEEFADSGKKTTWKSILDQLVKDTSYEDSGMPVLLGRKEQ